MGILIMLHQRPSMNDISMQQNHHVVVDKKLAV